MNAGKKTPCGMCHVGVYNELALINEKAVKFMSLTPEERINQIPSCQRFNRKCVGYIDLHKLKTEVDELT